MLRFIGIIYFLNCLIAPHAFALGRPSWDLELDAYYSALGLNIPFKAQSADNRGGEEEMKTYREMLRLKSWLPGFLVVEGSVNPLPAAGVVVRKNTENFYQKAQATRDLNLIEAVTAGFQEPYALALFLGQIIDFAPGEKNLKRSKKGYVGYLASAGNYHILDSMLIADNWLELEAKIKGDLGNLRRKMSWSFRVGAKLHHHPEILDTYYIGLRRNRIDYEKTPLSFILSSAIEYRLDFDRENLRAAGHYVLLEKNMPLAKQQMAFSIGLGYLWQSREKYSGDLANRRRGSLSQILIRPNLKF